MLCISVGMEGASVSPPAASGILPSGILGRALSMLRSAFLRLPAPTATLSSAPAEEPLKYPPPSILGRQGSVAVRDLIGRQNLKCFSGVSARTADHLSRISLVWLLR